MAEITPGGGNRPPPNLLHQATAGKVPGVITATTEQLFAMARKSSLWTLSFGLACCAIEMISTYMAHYDFDRFGVVTWPSPRQSDVMIVDIFAILFLIFDVEAVFLFPWAVIFLDQALVEANPIPFYAMMMFLGVLFFAIVYAWKKGALEWQR